MCRFSRLFAIIGPAFAVVAALLVGLAPAVEVQPSRRDQARLECSRTEVNASLYSFSTELFTAGARHDAKPATRVLGMGKELPMAPMLTRHESLPCVPLSAMNSTSREFAKVSGRDTAPTAF
jgi:hypothetical protein